MDRRRFLRTSAAALGMLVAGRLGIARATPEARDLVVVSSPGDASDGAVVTLIDPLRLEVLATLPSARSFSFPANRWHFDRDLLWSGVPGGERGTVSAQALGTGERVAEVTTGSTENYAELTPDGRFLIVAARYEHVYLKVSADPLADDFGAVVATLRAGDRAQPCDATITPDGALAIAPERGTDTLAVIDVESFEPIARLRLEPHGETPLEPYMATASPAGGFVLVENASLRGGPDRGSESIVDIRDPARPAELARLSQADGLGSGPITSEFTWDGRFGIVVCRDSSELSVIDMEAHEVAVRVALPDGGSPLTGTFARDGTTFFVPLPGRDAVAAVAVPEFELRTLIPVPARPLGAVYLHTSLPDRQGTHVRVGSALSAGRAFPDDCPDACCGPV